MKALTTLIFLNCILLICNCGPATGISGGGGSETTNSITVCVKKNQISGQAASGADVQLYHEMFNPIVEILPESLKIEADSSGRFLFPQISNGVYNIYSKYDSAGSFPRVLFITTVKVPSDTIINQIYLPPTTVEVVVIKDNPLKLPVTLISTNFYFKGTPFYIEKDVISTDSVIIDNIPAATFNCEISSTPYSYGTIKFEYPDSITVKNVSDTYISDEQIIIYVKSNTMKTLQ